MLTTLYITKCNQNRIWKSSIKDKPFVQRRGKMEDSDFEKCKLIIEEIKKEKQGYGN